ncbi:metallophosphoesterase [Marinoscillum sp.]|uniref:metallophosphoesterase n=1 Tax=Marinoscillum sp. TaxID=2024838 RepID=UPI003BA9E0F7
MTIQYASDLHLEFPANQQYLLKNPIEPIAKVLLLAGDSILLNDTVNSSKVLDLLSEGFEKVYMIPGNHEFYGKHFPIAAALPSFRKQVRENMHYVNNETIIIGDVRILFTTLFSQIPDSESSNIKKSIQDFHRTRYHEDSMLSLSIDEFNHCHKVCLGYLLLELERPFYGKTVVVSHFPPFTKKWIKDYPEFPMDLSPYFHADLEWVCKEHAIDHWISGHTHINFESFKIGNTWMHSNMLGYVEHDDYNQFNKRAILDI